MITRLKSLLSMVRPHRSTLLWLTVSAALLGLLGGMGIPWYVKERILPDWQPLPGHHLRLERLVFNPYTFKVSADGLTLSQGSEAPWLSVTHLMLDLDLLHSLASARPVLALSLKGPTLTLPMDPGGHPVWPDIPNGSEGGSSTPLLWSKVQVEQGTLTLLPIRSGGQAEVLGPFHLTIRDLDFRGIGRAFLKLDFQTAARGHLALEGYGGMHPPGVEVDLSLEALDAGFYQHLLAKGLPFDVRSGRLTTRLHLEGNPIEPRGLAVEAPSFHLDDLTLSAEGRLYEMKRVSLEGIHFRSGAEGISLKSLHGEGLKGAGYGVGVLDIQGVSGDPDARSVQWASLKAGQVVTPWGALEQVEGGPLIAHGDNHTLTLDRLFLPRVDVPSGRILDLAIDGLEYAPQDDRVSVATVNASAIEGKPVAADHPRIDGLTLGLKERTVAIQSASALSAVVEDHRLQKPLVEGLRWDSAANLLQPQHIHLQSISGPVIETAQGDFVDLTFDLSKRTGSLAHGDLEGVRSPGGNVGKVIVDRLMVHLQGPEVRVGHCEVKALRTDLMSADHLLLNEAEYVVQDQVLRFDAIDVVGAVGTTMGKNIYPPEGESGSLGWAQQPHPLTLGHLNLHEGAIDFLWKRLLLTRMTLNQSVFDLRKLKRGGLTIAGLPDDLLSRPDLATSPRGDYGWRYTIDEIALSGTDFYLQDQSVTPNARQRFMGTELIAEQVTTSRDETLTFALKSHLGESGKVEAEGRAVLHPLRANFRFGIDKLRLRAIEPYWRPFTTLDVINGRLNLWGDLIVRDNGQLEVDYNGGADLVDLELQDHDSKAPVASLESMKFDGLSISTQPQRFVTRVLTLRNPLANIQLNEQHDLNLKHLLIRPLDTDASAAASSIAPRQVTKKPLPAASIGLLRIENAGVEFNDLSIKPGFHVEIKDLSGTSSGISSRDDALATLLMEGHINLLTPVKVYGELDPVDYADHTDLDLTFKGLNLTSFSNYSGKFAGYRIEKGKLDLSVRYRLEQGALDIENQAVIDNLTLGEQVDSEASSWLVDVALSLLKNEEGKIDMNLPISGDLTNPSFSLWALYHDAFNNLLGKIIRSPLALIPTTSEPLSVTIESIPFAPGEVNLDETARGKLKEVAVRLRATPGANLDIRPVMAPNRDRRALAQNAMDAQLKVEQRLDLRNRGIKWGNQALPALTAVEANRLFTIYFKKTHPTPSDFHGIAINDQEVLSGELLQQAKETVLSGWLVGEVELQRLALHRAEHIRESLIKDGGISDSLLYLRDLEAIEGEHAPIAADLILNRE